MAMRFKAIEGTFAAKLGADAVSFATRVTAITAGSPDASDTGNGTTGGLP